MPRQGGSGRVGGRKGPKTIYPTRPVVVSISFVTSSPSMTAPDTYQAVVVVQSGPIPVEDGDGQNAIQVLTDRTVTWSSSDTGVLTVSSDGLYTGIGAGTATVTASCEGVSTTQVVTVENPQAPLDSLVVTPATFELAAGQTVIVSAEPRDAGGNPLTGQTVTWQSSNATIATVGADSGTDAHFATVTAVAAGSVTITATCGAETDTSDGTVTAGGTLYFSDGLETGNFNLNQGGFRWSTGNWGTGGDTPDAAPVVTTTKPRTGSYSIQFEYGAESNPQSDAWCEKRFILGQNVTEIYACFHIYCPGPDDAALGTASYLCRNPGTPATQTNNKFLRFWDIDYNGYHVKGGASTYRSSNDNAYIAPEYGWPGTGTTVGPHNLPNEVPGGGTASAGNIFSDATRGTWIKYKQRLKLSSGAGVLDAAIQIWINDVLKFSNTAFLWWNPNQGANNFFKNGYLLGWTNTSFAGTTRFWIDDFKLGSTAEIVD